MRPVVARAIGTGTGREAAQPGAAAKRVLDATRQAGVAICRRPSSYFRPYVYLAKAVRMSARGSAASVGVVRMGSVLAPRVAGDQRRQVDAGPVARDDRGSELPAKGHASDIRRHAARRAAPTHKYTLSQGRGDRHLWYTRHSCAARSLGRAGAYAGASWRRLRPMGKSRGASKPQTRYTSVGGPRQSHSNAVNSHRQ